MPPRATIRHTPYYVHNTARVYDDRSYCMDEVRPEHKSPHPCRDWEANRCKWGRRCKFQHVGPGGLLATTNRSMDGQDEERKCYGCGKPGHISRNCPANKDEKKNSVNFNFAPDTDESLQQRTFVFTATCQDDDDPPDLLDSSDDDDDYDEKSDDTTACQDDTGPLDSSDDGDNSDYGAMAGVFVTTTTPSAADHKGCYEWCAETGTNLQRMLRDAQFTDHAPRVLTEGKNSDNVTAVRRSTREWQPSGQALRNIASDDTSPTTSTSDDASPPSSTALHVFGPDPKSREEPYMKQLEGHEEPDKEDYVCKCTRSIYGCPQAPVYAQAELKSTLTADNAYKPTAADNCVYVEEEAPTRGEQGYAALDSHVDDLAPIDDPAGLQRLKDCLHNITVKKNPTMITGVKMERVRTSRSTSGHHLQHGESDTIVCRSYLEHKLSNSTGQAETYAMQEKAITLSHVHTSLNPADMQTKALPRDAFTRHRRAIMDKQDRPVAYL